MPNTHLARLLRMIILIRGRSARNAADLSRELEVTERTVYRDLELLSMSGVGCRFDKEAGGYRIDGDFFLPPTQLTLGEALALSVLGSQVGRDGQMPFLGDAWRAVTKVRAQLPASIRDDVAGADGAVRVRTASVSPQAGSEAHFETLRRAIADRRKVRCTYARDGRGTVKTRGRGDAGIRGRGDGENSFLFRPYALYFGQRAWYVIGYSERSAGERSLKLNRLTRVDKTDRPYMVPDDWSLEKCFGKAWRMIRGDRRYIVRIRFDADHGRNVADTLWHPTQTIEWQADGSLLFRCEVDGLEEIVWWVMGYGPHAEVLEPAELRRTVGELAKAMCVTYLGRQAAVERAKRSDPGGPGRVRAGTGRHGDGETR